MSISPLGNVVLVNQMTPLATIPQNAHTNRIELQNFMTQMEIQEKEQEIMDLQEAEESHALNPDREHNQEESDEAMRSLLQKKRRHNHEEEQESGEPLHKLDIKV